MGFGFRVGPPGMSVRVSSRGVRASVGPRAARVHVNGVPSWKLRALGQGWAEGLGGLARAHGVDVD